MLASTSLLAFTSVAFECGARIVCFVSLGKSKDPSYSTKGSGGKGSRAANGYLLFSKEKRQEAREARSGDD